MTSAPAASTLVGMRKLLLLALAGGAAYGASLLLLRAGPAPEGARPEQAFPASAEDAGSVDPFARPVVPSPGEASEPLYAEPPPQEKPWGADAPARPNVRSLKVAGVPEPGRARTEEEAWRARVLDAAARGGAGVSLGSMGAGGGAGATGSVPSYRAPGPRPAETEEQGAGAERAASVRRGVRGGGAAQAVGGAGTAKPGPGAVTVRSGEDAVAAEAPPAPGAGKTPPPAAENVGWSPAANLVKAAQGLSFSKPDAASLRLANDPVGKELLRAQAVDSGARAALAKLQENGGRPTEEQRLDAVRGAFAAAGINDATDAELREQLALADQPASAPPAPQEMLQFLDRTRAALPSEADQDALAAAAMSAPRLNPEAERDPPPRGPPPRNAAAAYRAVRDALEQGHRDFGVLPKHSFGIFGVESGFGRNTGRYLVMPVLYSEIRTRAPGSARHRQAQRDVAAMFELERRGALGPGNTAANMRGSHGASFGHTQFRPSSWLAYGRDPDGGRAADPYDMRTAVYSTANYLRGHGYSRNVDRAIYGYNHDWGYVRSVQNMAARVESSIIAPSRR